MASQIVTASLLLDELSSSCDSYEGNRLKKKSPTKTGRSIKKEQPPQVIEINSESSNDSIDDYPAHVGKFTRRRRKGEMTPVRGKNSSASSSASSPWVSPSRRNKRPLVESSESITSSAKRKRTLEFKRISPPEQFFFSVSRNRSDTSGVIQVKPKRNLETETGLQMKISDMFMNKENNQSENHLDFCSLDVLEHLSALSKMSQPSQSAAEPVHWRKKSEKQSSFDKMLEFPLIQQLNEESPVKESVTEPVSSPIMENRFTSSPSVFSCIPEGATLSPSESSLSLSLSLSGFETKQEQLLLCSPPDENISPILNFSNSLDFGREDSKEEKQKDVSDQISRQKLVQEFQCSLDFAQPTFVELPDDNLLECLDSNDGYSSPILTKHTTLDEDQVISHKNLDIPFVFPPIQNPSFQLPDSVNKTSSVEPTQGETVSIPPLQLNTHSAQNYTQFDACADLFNDDKVYLHVDVMTRIAMAQPLKRKPRKVVPVVSEASITPPPPPVDIPSVAPSVEIVDILPVSVSKQKIATPEKEVKSACEVKTTPKYVSKKKKFVPPRRIQSK